MTHTVPIRPANPAPPAPLFPWPDGKSCALFLSLDVDAEAAWTSKDPAMAERLVTMSFGGYEARVGVPMLLELLRRLGLKATFFITGWAADAHPAMCESILRDGHEIGHHGYYHLMPEPADAAAMEDELDRGFDALQRRLGVVPVGYRAPYGESFEALRASLARRGMLYSSSWRDDVRPYRQVLADGKDGVIELPVTMSYDDWLYGLTNRFSPRPLFPREHVLSIWNDELEVTRQWGGMVTTVLHPQVSGRPMRLALLREFLFDAMVRGDIWIATGQEIARHFEQCERAAASAAQGAGPATLPDEKEEQAVVATPAPPQTPILPVLAGFLSNPPAVPWPEDASVSSSQPQVAAVPPLPPPPPPSADAVPARSTQPAASERNPPVEEPPAPAPMPEPPVEEPPRETPPEGDPPGHGPPVEEPPAHQAAVPEAAALPVATPEPETVSDTASALTIPPLRKPHIAWPSAPAVAPEPLAGPATPLATPLTNPFRLKRRQGAKQTAAASQPAAPPTRPAAPAPAAPAPAAIADAGPPTAQFIAPAARPRLDLPSAFPAGDDEQLPPPQPSKRVLKPPPPPPPLAPRPPQRFGLFERGKS